jgi:hypothetical protein
MERVIINTVGKSAILNLRNYPKKEEFPAGVELNRLNELLKKEDSGREATAYLLKIMNLLDPFYADPKFRLTPAEISSINAIPATRQDKLFFLVGSSPRAIADEGEVCGKALAAYYTERFGENQVELVRVHGMVLNNGELDHSEEMLHELDQCVKKIRRTVAQAPVIINMTGGYRLSGIYAALVGLVHGCELYYYHQDMELQGRFGLPAVAPEVLQLPLRLEPADYGKLDDHTRRFYKKVGHSFERIELVDIVSRFPRYTEPKSEAPTRHKILFLSASPNDKVRSYTDKELREVEEELEHGGQSRRFDLKYFGAVRPPDFTGRLLRENPYLLHFSGHGLKTGEICLEDDQGKSLAVPPERLANLFKHINGQVQAVVLSACYTEKQAQAIAEHVPFVIGVNTALKATIAQRFARGFYQFLSTKFEIEAAFQWGKAQAGLYKEEDGAEQIFVLFKNGQKVID